MTARWHHGKTIKRSIPMHRKCESCYYFCLCYFIIYDDDDDDDDNNNNNKCISVCAESLSDYMQSAIEVSK